MKTHLETPAGDRGLFEGLVKDGRPLLALTGLALAFSGGFALFLSATGQFLPHDIQFLGMTAADLRSIAEQRLVNFMFHDRVAFGGSLIAIGVLYLWMAEFALGEGEAWAWWAFVVSGTVGFGSFLTYLGYGYLDSWHGVGTACLLPLFVFGLVRSRAALPGSRSIRSLWKPLGSAWKSKTGLGRLLLAATGAGMVAGGATIMVVGMTSVFVPQDLAYMGVSPDHLKAVNIRLVPLIAHDRAGFGGGICSCGLLVLICAWHGRPSRSLVQALGIAGLAGFGSAIGVHFVIGYTDFIHLLPAYIGFGIYIAGMFLFASRANGGA